MDPSGTFVQCDARAIGSASEGAQSSLQEVYHKVIKHSHAFSIIFKFLTGFTFMLILCLCILSFLLLLYMNSFLQLNLLIGCLNI